MQRVGGQLRVDVKRFDDERLALVEQEAVDEDAEEGPKVEEENENVEFREIVHVDVLVELADASGVQAQAGGVGGRRGGGIQG